MSGAVEMNKEHYEELIAIECGADIMGHYNAKLLREIEKTHPTWIKIVDAQGSYDPVEQLPYFGAIATMDGLFHARRRLARIENGEAA